MIRNPKALLGLCLLIVLAMSATGGGGASATSGGHFTSEANHTEISGTESTGFIEGIRHTIQFFAMGSVVKCHSASYTGTLPAKTVTEITLTPEYFNCTMNEETDPTPSSITMNGCDYLFTIRSNNVDSEFSTVHLKCPAGKEIEIHTTNCTLKIPGQTTEGAAYNKITVAGKHAITLIVNTDKLTYSRHGFCSILGTHTKDAIIKGSLTLHSHSGLEIVGLTATGSS